MVILKEEMEKQEELKGVEDIVGKWKPEDFLVASDKVRGSSLRLLKQLYDLTKLTEKDARTSDCIQQSLPLALAGRSKKDRKKRAQLFSKTEVPLESLITQDFDQDQIWEEIQLQNTLIYDTLVSSISKVLAHKPKIKRRVEEDDEDEEDEQAILKDLDEEEEEEEDESDSDSDFFESDEKKRKSAKAANYAKSVVDDKFFNLAQMTEFLEKVEREQEGERMEDNEEEESEGDGDQDQDIDYFNEDEEGDEEENEVDYYYKDFFDPPLDHSNKEGKDGGDKGQELEKEDESHNEPESEEGSKEDEHEDAYDVDDQQDEGFPESEANEAVLSTYEKKKRKIEENIKAMENEALQPKPWHLTGEVAAEGRPENSLLEEHLMYDHLLRQAPEITMKTTQKLEDIIKQRIKDQGWNDVIRKIKPIEDVAEYKKRLVLDAEKSKMSLTEIYEKEYIEKHKQTTEVTEEEKDPEEHKVIKKDMQSVFAKLDALTHFNYTPKAPVPEIKTIRNASATSAEEITPSAFSDATLLAPQEILEPAKGDIKSKDERTATDKKRERRLKKKKQHLKRLTREEKARARGLGLRNVKLAETVVKKSKRGQAGEDRSSGNNNKELKSSKAFFAKLQEQATSHIDRIAKRKSSRTNEAKTSVLAKKYKL